MKERHFSEKGQILVLMALVLVGLLGFTALAVDGGMIYADRRYMQSSADAASLAGAGVVASVVEDLNITSAQFDCSPLASGIANGYTAAINKAVANDFTIAKDNSLGTGEHNNGVDIICSSAGEYVDVFVMLTRDTTTSFVQLFTGAPMRNTISSVTRVKPGLNAGDGSAIVSLSKDCHANADGVWISGNNETFLINGGIWSNSCVERNGNAKIDITGGGVNYYHTGYVTGISNPIPAPQPDYHPLTDVRLIPYPEELCSKTDPYNDLKFNTIDPANDPRVIDPGNYGSWDFNVPVKLNAGLYCINGKVSMSSSAWVIGPEQPGGNGDGVTIYFTGTDLTINGGADTTLAAPNGYEDPINPPPSGAIEDVLLYIPPGTVADVKINGGSNNVFAGTMYMPSSEITVNGTSDSSSKTDMFVSIIGYAVKINGTSYLNITYDPDRDYGMTSYLQVQK